VVERKKEKLMAFTERKVIEIDWSKENKGMEVQGRLVSVETIQYTDGPGLVYTVKGSKPGEVIRFRGATRLNQRLHKSDIGKVIAVRYNGEDKTKEMKPGMNPPKDFIVMVDEGSINPDVITDDDLPHNF
jgi:hypothetical protein